MDSKLSPTEYQYMEIIWSHPEGIACSEVYSCFPQALSTKSTILRRITKKGHIRSEQKGKQVYYYPLISKRDYEKALLQEEINEKMGFSSFHKLFAAFCGKPGLTDQQVRQLKDLIEKLEKDE